MVLPRHQPLVGRWEATKTSGGLLRDLGQLESADWATVSVPGRWQREPDLAEHSGTLSYRHHFEPPSIASDERCWLHVDGIFSQGDIWLDGEYVGDTEGYFFPHRFDITELVGRRAQHELVIDVVSNTIGDSSRKNVITGSFQYGDFFPPSMNPGGIWKTPEVHTTGPVTILHSRVLCPSAEVDRATLDLRVVLDSIRAETVALRTRVGAQEFERSHVLAAGENRLEWSVTITEPELWWPHRLGDQPISQLSVAVELESGAVSDELERTIGLRSVRSVDGNLVINGERLYLKGTCLGPTDSSLAETDEADLRRDIVLARDAGLDLVALHAHISRPELYHHADRTGMLIWQDLPLDGGYARSIKPQALRQAREAVDLLGHHPSIVAWCPRSDPKRGTQTAEGRLSGAGLDRSLRRVLSNLDGTRPIAHARPTDAAGAGAPHGFRLTDGGLLDQMTSRSPAEVTRFGAPSVTAMTDVQAGRWPRLHWQQLVDDLGLDIESQLKAVPIEPYDSLAAWARATRRHQAQVMKGTIETGRKNKYGSSAGYLQYYLRSPRLRWSYGIADQNGVGSLAYDALRAASAPVIVIADHFPTGLVAGESTAIGVHVVSDLHEPLIGCRVDATLTDPAGTASWSWGGDLEPDSVTQVGTVHWLVPVGWGEVSLELRLTTAEMEIHNRYQARLPR